MNKPLHNNYRKTLEMLLALSLSSPLEALKMIFTKSSAQSFQLCVTDVKFSEKSWEKKGGGQLVRTSTGEKDERGEGAFASSRTLNTGKHESSWTWTFLQPF